MLVVKCDPSILVAMQHNMRFLKLGDQLDMFMICGVLLGTYQHLLCCLSLALAGLLSRYLVSGSSICICIAHPINTATVHAKDVGTRQKKIQVNNQNLHCLDPAMSQASSIWRAAKAISSVLSPYHCHSLLQCYLYVH